MNPLPSAFQAARDPAPAEAKASRRGQVLALIVASGLLRLVLNDWAGPTVDEAYTVVMARQPAPSYFDHPPLIYWLVALTVWITGSEAPFVVRLPFVLMFMGTTWLAYRLTTSFYGERAGLWAAAMLNLSLYHTLCRRHDPRSGAAS